MRVELAFLGVAAMVLGCGGKVVFEGQSDGGLRGVGGSVSSSSTTTTGPLMVSTGASMSCTTTGCTAGSDGSCACDGVCNQQKLHVDCTPFQGGATCVCSENGIGIAKCQQSGVTCDFVESCCGQVFFDQTGNDG
jgi:hypothetical protein